MLTDQIPFRSGGGIVWGAERNSVEAEAESTTFSKSIQRKKQLAFYILIAMSLMIVSLSVSCATVFFYYCSKIASIA